MLPFHAAHLSIRNVDSYSPAKCTEEFPAVLFMIPNRSHKSPPRMSRSLWDTPGTLDRVGMKADLQAHAVPFHPPELRTGNTRPPCQKSASGYVCVGWGGQEGAGGGASGNILFSDLGADYLLCENPSRCRHMMGVLVHYVIKRISVALVCH